MMLRYAISLPTSGNIAQVRVERGVSTFVGDSNRRGAIVNYRTLAKWIFFFLISRRRVCADNLPISNRIPPRDFPAERLRSTNVLCPCPCSRFFDVKVIMKSCRFELCVRPEPQLLASSRQVPSTYYLFARWPTGVRHGHSKSSGRHGLACAAAADSKPR